MEWQTTTTAPRDGTHIVVAQWDEEIGRWEFVQSYWRMYLPGYGGGFGWFGYSPTHWAPLPEAPLG